MRTGTQTPDPKASPSQPAPQQDAKPCCGPEVLDVCCEPSEKQECCGPENDSGKAPTKCGC